jgi:hypothetical protein
MSYVTEAPLRIRSSGLPVRKCSRGAATRNSCPRGEAKVLRQHTDRLHAVSAVDRNAHGADVFLAFISVSKVHSQDKQRLNRPDRSGNASARNIPSLAADRYSGRLLHSELCFFLSHTAPVS